MKLLIVGSGSKIAKSFIESCLHNKKMQIIHCDISSENVPDVETFIELDFSDSEAVEKVFTSSYFQDIDALVVFAVECSFGQMGDSLKNETLQISRNVSLLYNAVVSFGSLLKSQQRKGQAVVLSSINEDIPVPGFATYCISKATIRTIIKCATREFKPFLRINAVAPGPVYKDKGIFKEFPGFLKGVENKHFLEPRLAKPDDIVPVIEFLLSESSGWVAGETIKVDGGASFNWGEIYTT